MAWIELHQSLPQHRKLLALRDALGLRTPAALGHMCLLWLWALDNAPDGDLSALPARQLAEICQFSERRAGDLAVALRTSGFVDADWRLHDWGDYTGRLIDQRAASRERQRRGGGPPRAAGPAARGGHGRKQGGWYMKKQTNTDLRRKLREQRAAYEELLGLSGAILAALCVRCGDGATLRLPKQAVHDALETYEFAAAADGEDYVLSYRERAT